LFYKINTAIDYNGSYPRHQFSLVAVLVDVPEHTQHGIVENDTCAIHISCIAQAGADHVGIAMPVQLLLALHIVVDAPFDDYVKRIGQQNWLG
jgi:hypothetical protein